MYERFGEFTSASEINETAVNLRREGDRESLMELAKENGIDEEIAECFMDGEIIYLCDHMIAAIGKIDVERAELKLGEILDDWANFIRDKAGEDEEFAKAVRKKGKSLVGVITELLKWGLKNQYPVSQEIQKAAGVTGGRCTLGIPGTATAKRIITEYYMS